MDKKYKYLIVVLLIVVSFIAFSRSLGNDFINFDDSYFITDNNHIKTGFNAESIKWAFTTSSPDFWHPLTWLSFMLEWRLFGADATGYHLFSLLWHIGSAILLFLFLSKTTGSLWPSAFVAALYALHPLRVESVAWAAERKDVLSVFFGMATLYAYAYYVAKPQVSKYIICLLLFILSLLSKPTLITLPFVMLLLDFWPLGRLQKVLTPQSVPVLIDKRGVKKKSKNIKAESSVDKRISTPAPSGRQLIGSLLLEKVPFFILAIALSVMIIGQLQKGHHMASLQQNPLSARIMNAIVSYVGYLGKTFWPVDLAVFYPYVNSFPMWKVLGASLILVGISTAVICLAKKAPFLAVGWLWYLGVLFPVIGLMQAGGQAMADRYTYFSSIGIAIMLTWGVIYLLPKEKLRKIIIIPAVIILAVLTFLTWRQCGYWKNSTTLFSHVLQVTKDNVIAHTCLGFALFAQGKQAEAIAHYSEAIRIDPYYDIAHYDLGIALEAQGKQAEANAHYLAAIKSNPSNLGAHLNLAVALGHQGRVEEAIALYREALRINPDYSSAHINLGVILGKQLKHHEAVYHFRQALRIDPNDPAIYLVLGVALANTGNLNEAIANFRTAIYFKPDYAEARMALKITLDIAQKR